MSHRLLTFKKSLHNINCSYLFSYHVLLCFSYCSVLELSKFCIFSSAANIWAPLLSVSPRRTKSKSKWFNAAGFIAKKKEFDSMALASSKRKLVFEITKDHFCLRFWYLLLFKIKHFQVRVSCICKIPLVSDCWFYILINNWFFSLISDRCVSLWLWAWIS